MCMYPWLKFKIGHVKETPGTETSKYRKEKKETSIPLVAASERGPAQYPKYEALLAEAVWKVLPQRVTVPYAKGS